jgi:hypothetical protein
VRKGSVWLLPIVLVASACGLTGSSTHVRDGAELFSPIARASAEQRLRELASQHGMLLFVISDPAPDPPRMLDAPMADAKTRGMPAVAVLFGPNGIAGTGYSDELYFSFVEPSAAEHLLQQGRADEALEVLVDHFAAWSRDPDSLKAPSPPAIAPRPS